MPLNFPVNVSDGSVISGGMIGLLFCGFWIATVVIHIAFAVAVYTDSEYLWGHFRRKTFLVGGGMWALATLLGGVFVAAIYWLIHHSTLRPHRMAPGSSAEPGQPGNG